MSIRDRLKKLAARFHASAKPKPGVVRVCLTKAEEDAARKEFRKLPDDVFRAICTVDDTMGEPKRRLEAEK